jgi:hypothetical protein
MDSEGRQNTKQDRLCECIPLIFFEIFRVNRKREICSHFWNNNKAGNMQWIVSNNTVVSRKYGFKCPGTI